MDEADSNACGDRSALEELARLQKVIAEMKSNDPEISSAAVLKAHNILRKIPNNKSSSIESDKAANEIIASSSDQLNTEPVGASVNLSDANSGIHFGSSDSLKARELENKEIERLKSEAFICFKTAEYERAVIFYTNAIAISDRRPVLYINRAQCHLRLGDPDNALVDCDAALKLLPPEPKRTPTNLGAEADAARELNRLASKACLHRGKALMKLERACDALAAYTDSREFKWSAENPGLNRLINPHSDKWPEFLRDYVTEAETAVAASNIDLEAKDILALRFTTDEPQLPAPYTLRPKEKEFLRLVDEIADENVDILENTNSLFKLAQLLGEVHDGLESDHSDSVSESTQHAFGEGNHSTLSQDSKSKNDPISFQRLQAFFRVKHGFDALKRQLDICNSNNTFEQLYYDVSKQNAKLADTCLIYLLHLRGLLTVCYHLCFQCGESQRLLFERLPELFRYVLLECLQLHPLETTLPNPTYAASFKLKDASQAEITHRSTMDDIRCVACELIALLTLEASGRQALLVNPGPARLLAALAVCLSDALGLPNSQSSRKSVITFGRSSPKADSVPSSFPGQTVAAVSCILEKFANSPHFLGLVRSLDCLASLQEVIEAAVAIPPPSSPAITPPPAVFISLLMDSLSSACHDPELRRHLASKPNFITSLATSFLRYAPLTSDEINVTLVGSLCRLLNNCLTGERSLTLSSDDLTTLISAVGIILDQSSTHGSAILSVVVVFLGLILPMCSTTQIERWCISDNRQDISASSDHQLSTPERAIRKRIKYLISTVKSYPISVLRAADAPLLDENGRAHESPESLNCQCLRGAVRTLAVITKVPGCDLIRVRIGSDRLVARRLSCLICARGPYPSGFENGRSSSAPPPPLDETLVANACLLLHNCLDDTPLGGNLEGSTIFANLFKFVDEAKRMEPKRNAAMFAWKLANASDAHRDMFKRLQGFNPLSPFNKWTRDAGVKASTCQSIAGSS